MEFLSNHFAKIVLGFLGIGFVVAIVFGIAAKGIHAREWDKGGK